MSRIGPVEPAVVLDGVELATAHEDSSRFRLVGHRDVEMEQVEGEDEALTIGEVVEQVDVSRDTLRYWEERGVIPEPPRFESSGYRAYPPETVRRVRAVVRGKELGFSLDEIKQLFERRSDGETCGELADVARERIREFQEEIERLERKIEGLRSLSQTCPDEMPASDCPVVDLLAES